MSKFHTLRSTSDFSFPTISFKIGGTYFLELTSKFGHVVVFMFTHYSY